MGAPKQEFYLLVGGVVRLGVEKILGKEFRHALPAALRVGHQDVIARRIVAVLDNG
jgi:hypothetical protein